MPVNQHLIFRSHGIHIHIQGFSSWSQSVVRPRVSLTKTNEVVLRHWWWGKWRDKFQMSRILGFTWLFNAALIELPSKDYEYWFDLATGSTLFLFFMLIPPLRGMITHSHLNQVNSSWWKSLTNSVSGEDMDRWKRLSCLLCYLASASKSRFRDHARHTQKYPLHPFILAYLCKSSYNPWGLLA